MGMDLASTGTCQSDASSRLLKMQDSDKRIKRSAMMLNPYQPPEAELRASKEFPRAKRTYTLRIITGHVVRILTAMSFVMLLGSMVIDEIGGVAIFGCLTGFFVVLSAATVSR
ncbi:MAG: hypothetical protein Rhob2KO_41640 [Rhodopirellula baltica]